MGIKGLEEESKRPLSSPSKTPKDTEIQILEVRLKHPAWGARKIRAYLQNKGVSSLPTPSTITRILHRYDKIQEEESRKHKPFIRFEHALPNQLWQMDFKGYFYTEKGRCNPLTVLDDHSRYSLDIRACHNQQSNTVKAALTNIFREYGLPERMTMDNGTPWGSPGSIDGYTALEVWLICLGIRVGHSRPFHPQTQGKDERFHRSLQVELIDRVDLADLAECQQHFDSWRHCYNYERPHEALGMKPPVSRYQASVRKYTEQFPNQQYEPGAILRKVNHRGIISYRGERYCVSQSMDGLNLKISESHRSDIVEVYLYHQKVREIDLINKKIAKKIV